MASDSEAARLKRACRLLAGIAMLCFASRGPAQQALTLAQAGARQPPEYGPLHAGKPVVVRGVVAAPAFHFIAYTLLGIEDESGGIAVEVPASDTRLDGFRPGDELEVTGKVDALAGQPVIDPAGIRHLARRRPPEVREISLADLQGYRQLGRVVRTEGVVTEIGDNTAGAYVLINTRPAGGEQLKLFLPHALRQPPANLAGYSAGDRIRVTGLALQYCPRPPYTRWFELLVQSPNDIVRLHRSWFVPPGIIGTFITLLLAGAMLIWRRERRLRTQRERLRKIYNLGEELLGDASAEGILKRLGTSLTAILGVTRVRLYVYNRGTRTLDGISTIEAGRVSIPLASPPGGTQAGAAACFHYRTLLSIPDIDRSPFPVASKDNPGSPRSLLFVPMLSKGDVVGVLELDQDDRARDFTPDEQALAQHLGNQIGVAIRLLDQRLVQEQLFRTEKLAAVGRLISGVVDELQAPLASISELAGRACSKPHHCPAQREIETIRAESRKASEIVERLVSFATKQVETRAVDVNALLRNLVEFRQQDAKALGVRIREVTAAEPLWVLGSHGQLEQVFLNLLVHAEQSLADVEEKTITARASLLGRRVLVEIAFSAPQAATPEDSTAVLGVVRGVIAGHGGEVRLVRRPNADPCFEVDLPWAAKEQSPAPAATAVSRDPGSQVTALIIEPDENTQRQLLALLSARGYRVVPVNNSDTGLELAQRMRFELALCSLHSPGLNWVELSERLQSRVGGFVLLSDGYAPELVADFEGEGRFVVSKPVQEAEIDRVMTALTRPIEVERARTA
jgi:CheY-like chemotaxis protein